MGRPEQAPAEHGLALFVVLTLLGMAACAATPTARPAEPRPSSPPRAALSPSAADEHATPKIVVAIVIDQLAAWLAQDRLAQLPEDGGFARLRREGTMATNMRFLHAVTDTAPGHAALFSGAPPRDSGAFANHWIETETGIERALLFDAGTRLVTSEGVQDSKSSSARLLQAETVADRLRASRPDALLVSISIKDRGAIFGGGKTPNATLWFQGSEFVTSTAFATQLPSWSSGSKPAVAEALGSVWQPLDHTWLAEHAAEPDSALGEGALAGMSTIFPHDARTARRPDLAFRTSPSGDHAVVDLALRALRALPFERAGGLLSLSLSSTDYIGHVYGPDSWEWWDNLKRLDGELDRLMHELDRELGPEGYAVVLSADHGTSVLPETHGDANARPWCSAGFDDAFERPCVSGGRLDLGALKEKLETTAERTLGAGDWVLGASNPYVYLTSAAMQLEPRLLDRLLHVLEQTLEEEPGVERVFTNRKLPESCPAPDDESLGALVCRSLAPGAGQLYVVMRPGWFFETGYVPGRGVNHGSPRLHDRTVPLIVRAPHRVAAGRTIAAPISFATFARTVSALLDIGPPASAYPALSLTELH